VYLDKNFEEVELVEKNRRFRLENRKSKRIKQLLEEKEEKFKKSFGTLKTARGNSMAASTSALPSLHSHRQSNSKLSPQLTKMNSLSIKLNP